MTNHPWWTIVVLGCSCLACGVVPNQLGRVTQIEGIHQRYEFCSGARASAELQIENIFGEGNVAAIGKDWSFYVDMALAGRFRVVGSVVFTFSPSPLDKTQFFIEGWGRHLIHADGTNLLVGSTTFQIDGGRLYSREDLEKGFVVIGMQQDTVREFQTDRRRLGHRAEVYAKIHIVPVGESAFSIDYKVEHEIGLAQPGGSRSNGDQLEVVTIGYLRFDKPTDGRKLIDLDALTWVSSDYKKAVSKLVVMGTRGRKTEWQPRKPCPSLQPPTASAPGTNPGEPRP